MRRLAADPSLAQQRQTVTLGDALYEVRLTWRERLRGWYLDLYDAGGTLLVPRRRIEPGWGPLYWLAFEGSPTAVLAVIGPSPYRREDLGGALQVMVVSSSEVLDLIERAGVGAPERITVQVTP